MKLLDEFREPEVGGGHTARDLQLRSEKRLAGHAVPPNDGGISLSISDLGSIADSTP